MIKFTCEPHNEPVAVNISYRAIFDEDLTIALADAIGALANAVANARASDLSGYREELRWTKEFLLGFSLLAIGEARSVILLLSDGLNRHARVHLRSLFEYELRSKLLLADPSKSLDFRDSVAYELRKVGRDLGVSNAIVERDVAEALGINDASTVIGAKESTAFGGSVRSQMKDEIWAGKRYAGTFAGMSWISHGSILGIRELARAVSGAGVDLLSRAGNDGNGNDTLYHSAWIIVKFALWIGEQFSVPVDLLPPIASRLIAINGRLRIVSQEQEALAQAALKDREGRESS